MESLLIFNFIVVNYILINLQLFDYFITLISVNCFYMLYNVIHIDEDNYKINILQNSQFYKISIFIKLVEFIVAIILNKLGKNFFEYLFHFICFFLINIYLFIKISLNEELKKKLKQFFFEKTYSAEYFQSLINMLNKSFLSFNISLNSISANFSFLNFLRKIGLKDSEINYLINSKIYEEKIKNENPKGEILNNINDKDDKKCNKNKKESSKISNKKIKNKIVPNINENEIKSKTNAVDALFLNLTNSNRAFFTNYKNSDQVPTTSPITNKNTFPSRFKNININNSQNIISSEDYVKNFDSFHLDNFELNLEEKEKLFLDRLDFFMTEVFGLFVEDDSENFKDKDYNDCDFNSNRFKDKYTINLNGNKHKQY